MAEIDRAFSYDEKGQPVMVLYRNRPPVTTFRLAGAPKVEGYVIDLADAWMYSSESYPTLVRVFYGYDSVGNPMIGEEIMNFDRAMYAKCSELCHQFDLGLITSRKMADIASMIEDGIEELLRMPPKGERPEQLGHSEMTKLTVEQRK